MRATCAKGPEVGSSAARKRHKAGGGPEKGHAGPQAMK